MNVYNYIFIKPFNWNAWAIHLTYLPTSLEYNLCSWPWMGYDKPSLKLTKNTLQVCQDVSIQDKPIWIIPFVQLVKDRVHLI
jgi:poly-beta-hydroxyalkanoate depolymerase